MKVLTSNGFKSFDCVKITENHKNLIYIKTSLGKELKCTFNHKLRIKDGSFKEAEKLTLHDILFDGSFIKEINIIKCNEPVYDLVNVADGNHYLTNGITSHNCIFIDECLGGDSKVTIRNKNTGKIEEISLKDFYNRLQ